MVKRMFFILCVITLSSSTVWSQEKDHQRFAGCWVGRDASLSNQADSLNFISSKLELPKFIENYLMDWRLQDFQAGCLKNEESISYRHAIMRRVYNKKALVWIIESSNPIYDKLYIPNEHKALQEDSEYYDFPDLPFMNKSWRELAKERMKYLESKQ